MEEGGVKHCLNGHLTDAVPLLLIVSFMMFVFVRVVPNSPTELMTNRSTAGRSITIMHRRLKLSRPLLMRCNGCVGNLFAKSLKDSVGGNGAMTRAVTPELGPAVVLAFSSVV